MELSTVEECRAAAQALAADESEVENERGQVDWDATYDRIEKWYNLALPTDTDDERYKAIRKEITKARRAG